MRLFAVALLLIDCSVADGQDGGEASNTEGGFDAGGCDLTKEPKDVPQCVTDNIGVFVDAANGKDTSPGTKSAPVQTIKKALAIVAPRPRIFICAGTYAEDVKITAVASLYGGFECNSWNYSGTKGVVGASAHALIVDSVASPIVIADLDIHSQPATAPSESSIAALVNNSNVTFLRAKLTAEAGKDGSPGMTGGNYTPVNNSDPSIAGHDANNTAGGTRHDCTLCTDNKNSSGGPGGNGDIATPTQGGAGLPNLMGMAPKDGVGGAPGVGCITGTGHDGTDAAAASDAPALTTNGALTAMGFAPAAGVDSQNGGPGQGGGGGGGGLSSNKGGGGGGGCGGCGGAGGKGGGGGGASVALAAVGSTVAIKSSELSAKNAGAGGAGSAGQMGQAGGITGQNSTPGCTGGTGGTGGAGGAGSGGAGGISVGVLYKGMMPSVDTETMPKITVGVKGAKGQGGKPSVNDGPDGVAQNILQSP